MQSGLGPQREENNDNIRIMKRKEVFSFKKNIFVLHCKSTMNLIRNLAEEEEGTTIISLRQNAGRGRKGNEWVSKPGGLYFSFLLRPRFHPRWNEKLYLLTTKAVENVIQDYLPTKQVEFKVPNDVLVNRKKISGVLIDTKAEGNQTLFMIVGIGINISNEVPSIATSIVNEGAEGITPTDVLLKFQEIFTSSYNDWMANI